MNNYRRNPAIVKMSASLARAVAITLVILLSSGCASYMARKRLEGVAMGWCEMIRASQVIPVYPLTQDLAVGDVFLTQTTIRDQAKAYEKKGFLPLDDLQVRLPYTNFNQMYFNGYWKDTFGGTNIPHTQPTFANFGTFINVLTESPLPRAAFPTYTVQAQAGFGFNAAFPIQGIPVALSYLNSQQVNASITISDARTYGGDPAQLYQLLRDWAALPQTRTNLSEMSMNVPNTQVFLRIVSRVYYARAVDVSLQRADSQGGGAKAGTISDVSLVTNGNSSNIIANYTNLLGTLNGALSSITTAVSNATQIGGAARFVAASGSTVGLSESFDSLLAIGYLGFDVPVYTNGDIGFPIPTFQHINRKVDAPAAESESVRNARVFDTSVEKYTADVSDAYNAASNKPDWDAVVFGVTGKTNMADLIRTGTPQEWKDLYWTLKHRSFLK